MHSSTWVFTEKASLTQGRKSSNCSRYVLLRVGCSACFALPVLYPGIQNRGFTTILNDFMVDRVLRMTCLFIALFSGAFGLLFAYAASRDMPSDDQKVMYFAGGFGSYGLGLFVSLLVISVVEAAVKSVYVCWAKAPGSLLHTHPDKFRKLLKAWCKMYPAVRTNNTNTRKQNTFPKYFPGLADDGKLSRAI
eukprot:gb/GECG01007860.1/.p1 GENE.gb/GECG01007860.1/~~gb/GECG01007860.1/.p1  ORF type:complete len:192 (+),score=7.66 gb/GECG01007860.1/:1-576(+)